MKGKYYDNENFEKIGYTIIDVNLDKNILDNAKEAYQEIYQKSINGEYKYVRIYDDCLGKLNISAIEMPFHQHIIDDRIVEMLNATNIVEIAKERLGNHIKMTLSRYHVTGDISHIGMWHRDGDIGTKTNLLMSLFLYDEQGFELIEGSHNKELPEDNTIINQTIKSHSSLEKTVHASVKSNQMIVFNPAIIHRGISEKPRANIHFRFEVDPDYELIDSYENVYGFNEQWVSVLSNKNTIIIDSNIAEFIKDKSFKNFIRRLIKTVVHYAIFFLPLDSRIYKVSGIYPDLKLRKFFRLKYQF